MNRDIRNSSVMIVDDVAENLQVLAQMLQQDGFLVRPVPDGKLAIQAAISEPPDLILLDIMMPDMDGFQVCRELKQYPSTRDIPVIFLSALTDTFDKVRAFEAGGVDYITKPFQFEEARARVCTHLELYRLNRENQALMAKTLVASARTLVDMLSVIQPVLFDQSNRLRRYMRLACRRLNPRPEVCLQWEMAALLSQIGCVTAPEALLFKKQQGEFLSLEEVLEFQSHAVVAAELIGGIPRMEMAAEIIRRQHDAFRQEEGLSFSVDGSEATTLGGHLLRMLVDFDYLQMSGRDGVGALLAMQEIPSVYSPALLDVLRYVVEQEGKDRMEWVKLEDLSAGMMLMEDVVAENGKVVLHRTTELTGNLLSLLRCYAMRQPIRQPIAVLSNLPSNIVRPVETGKAVSEGRQPGIVLGDLVVDPASCTVKLQDSFLHLTATEYRILEAFCRQPGKVLSRMQIAEEGLGIMFDGYERTIDAHIKNIRQKMNAIQPESNYIRTVRGIGYKLSK